MEKFLVYQEWTSADDFDVEAARWVSALCAQHAAEQYMEANHHNMDYAPECILRVRRQCDVSYTRWRVVAESVMRANAERIDPDLDAKAVRS